jgi:hypothetical protein
LTLKKGFLKLKSARFLKSVQLFKACFSYKKRLSGRFLPSSRSILTFFAHLFLGYFFFTKFLPPLRGLPVVRGDIQGRCPCLYSAAPSGLIGGLFPAYKSGLIGGLFLLINRGLLAGFFLLINACLYITLNCGIGIKKMGLSFGCSFYFS